MKTVFIVSRGWDNPDCSPQIQEVFLKRATAIRYIQKDVRNTLHQEREILSQCSPSDKVRQSGFGPERWSIETLYNGWEDWCEQEVWILEEYKVNED
jgi:hypothetical protein